MTSHKIPILLLTLIASIAPAGCRTDEPDHVTSARVTPSPPALATTRPVPAPPATWLRTELYFGLARRGKTAVSQVEWGQFLVEVVTPRFPEGLSVVDATGQWRDTQTGKTIVEDSKVVILIHHPTAAAERAVEEIRAIYKVRFEQDSVLRVTTNANVGF